MLLCNARSLSVCAAPWLFLGDCGFALIDATKGLSKLSVFCKTAGMVKASPVAKSVERRVWVVKTLFRTGVVAALIIVACSCAALAEDIWYPWWDTTPGVVYYWGDWNSQSGSNPYIIRPDSITPSGDGTSYAQVTVGESGAGLMTGTWDGFGNASDFWDLGSNGTMHINVPTQQNTTFLFWVDVTCFEGALGATSMVPTVNVVGATQVDLSLYDGYEDMELRTVLENTGTVDGYDQQWVRYRTLWQLNPGDVFGGIDIAAGENGSIIDNVSVQVLPEPSALMLGVLGNFALLGWRRYRRK